jgi:hypothetical protein
VALSITIRIPLTAKHKRCMVVFAYGNGETVKLHMKFPKSSETSIE